MSQVNSTTDAPLGSFSRVDATNAEDMVARLDTMHMLDFFRAYKTETFSLMNLKAGTKAADIGCGTGDDALSIAGRVGESGMSVGFDISEAMLIEARKRHGAGRENLHFFAGAADALPVPAESFDAVRGDRVLTHVADVAAALKEMVRVLKPDGRLVISEPDMRGCWVASDHHAITDRVMQAIAASCRQPSIGRDLYHHFLDAGLDDVSLALRSVAIADPSAVERILKFRATVDTLVDEGALTEQDAELWLGEIEQRGRSNRFLAGVTIFIVDGRKPR